MGLKNVHPIINLIYFTCVIMGTLLFNHPICIGITWGVAFLYSVVLNGKRSVCLNLVLVLLVMVYVAWYSYYNHYGITNLMMNASGNEITLEAIVGGAIRGMRMATIIMYFSCIHVIFTMDKWSYLLGRMVPKLSLYVVILFRIMPRVRSTRHRITGGRSGIGLGIKQGNVVQRWKHLVAINSMTLTCIIEDFFETTKSMESRGYTLEGRSAYSLYRFDYRDRSLILFLFMCASTCYVGYLLNFMTIWYNPEIIIRVPNTGEWFIYAMYFLLCMIPVLLIGRDYIRWLERKIR